MMRKVLFAAAVAVAVLALFACSPGGDAAANDLGLPAAVSKHFRAADEAAQAGDAAAFREAVVAADGGVGNYTISPDGRKAFVGTGDKFDEYFDADMWEEPVFYFELGRGLVSYNIKKASYGNAAWSADARYCAFGVSMEGQPPSLYVTDAEAGEDVSLGYVGLREGGGFAFEGKYLVWLNLEEGAGESPLWFPGVRAFDLGAGKEIELLKADMSTFEHYPGSQYGGRVRLVPAAGVPPELKKAKLYIEYDGAYADCDIFGW